MNKERLLDDWAARVMRAAVGGHLGRTIAITHVETVCGPRAGTLRILAGLDAGRLMTMLGRQECAVLAQMIPQEWDFQGKPAVYLDGRWVCLTAGWPAGEDNSDVRLSQICNRPLGGGRWVLGVDELGSTVIASCDLADHPHSLISGMTGSGKTVALWLAIRQLCADPENRVVLVDGKHSASFRHSDRSPFCLTCQVGPVATEPDSWRGALVWAVQEMRRRYDSGYEDRLIIVVDEVQEVIQDPIALEALRRLVVMGRDADVHVIAATQHPVVDALGGPTVARNLGLRLSFRVGDDVAARVALNDSSLPAHRLLGRGDAYLRTIKHTCRLQGAYVTDDDLAAVKGNGFEVDTWPEVCAEDIGVEPRQRGRRSPWPAPAEIGAGLIAASRGQGRGLFQDAVEAAIRRRPGSDRADKTLTLCGEAVEFLRDTGWSLAQVEQPAVRREPYPTEVIYLPSVAAARPA